MDNFIIMSTGRTVTPGADLRKVKRKQSQRAFT